MEAFSESPDLFFVDGFFGLSSVLASTTDDEENKAPSACSASSVTASVSDDSFGSSDSDNDSSSDVETTKSAVSSTWTTSSSGGRGSGGGSSCPSPTSILTTLPPSGIDVNTFQDLQRPSRAPYSPYSTLSPHATARCLRLDGCTVKERPFQEHSSLPPSKPPSPRQSSSSAVSSDNTSSMTSSSSSSSSSSEQQQQPLQYLSRATHEPRLLTLPSTGERGAFCGSIDIITGQPTFGRLITQQHGQVYDGPFAPGLGRHGDDATLYDIVHSLKFHGSFVRDVPRWGSLVGPAFVYRGGLDENLAFHGPDGSLATREGILYEGEFYHGRYDGVGREVSSEGVVYKGQFVSGFRHGIGTLFVPEGAATAGGGTDEDGDGGAGGKVATIQIQGGGNNNKDDAQVDVDVTKYKYSYSGCWWHGRMEGEGHEIVHHRDDHYDGDGRGREVYTGQFFRSKRHGFGILTLPDQTAVEGTWRAGLPVCGPGWSITYPNGDKYHGCAVNHLPHGIGIMLFGQRSSDDDNDNDKKNNDNDDTKYEAYYGQFLEGRPHGEGLAVTRDGREVSGTWKEGRFIKQQSNKKEEAATTTTTTDGGVVTTTTTTITTHEDVVDEACCLTDGNNNNNDNKDDEFIEIDIDFDSLQTFSVLRQVLPKDFAMPESLVQGPSHAHVDGDGPNDQQHNTNDLLHRYPNHDTYRGCLDSCGLRQGQGRYHEHRSGATYEGEWHDNRRHGRGVLVTSQVKYSGEYRHDRRHGQGTLIFNDSSCYSGQFVNDAFHGTGTLCESDGRTYNGDWVDGSRHGEGLETMADGTVFLGEYRRGKRHGVGTLLEKRGGDVMYSGQWEDDRMHGEGVRVFQVQQARRLSDDDNDNGDEGFAMSADDDYNTAADHDGDYDPSSSTYQPRRRQYEGTFVKGKRSGKGILTTEDGRTFRGNWSNDLPVDGIWKITLRDGSKYTGHAKFCGGVGGSGAPSTEDGGGESSDVVVPDGLVQPHGHGHMRYVNGDAYSGNFVRGKRCGRGVCVFANGDRYDGEWTNDSINVKKGAGELRLADGTIHTFGGGSHHNHNHKKSAATARSSSRGVDHHQQGSSAAASRRRLQQ